MQDLFEIFFIDTDPVVLVSFLMSTAALGLVLYNKRQHDRADRARAARDRELDFEISRRLRHLHEGRNGPPPTSPRPEPPPAPPPRRYIAPAGIPPAPPVPSISRDPFPKVCEKVSKERQEALINPKSPAEPNKTGYLVCVPENETFKA